MMILPETIKDLQIYTTTYSCSEGYLDYTVVMQKATIVVVFALSAIACTTCGAPTDAKDDDVAENAIIEKSGLVSSRNRHGLSASTYSC